MVEHGGVLHRFGAAPWNRGIALDDLRGSHGKKQSKDINRKTSAKTSKASKAFSVHFS